MSQTSTIDMRGRLAGKVTVVTGSSSGLGRAVALAFASEGAALVVCADLQAITKGAEFGAEAAGTPTHEVIQQRHAVTKALFVRTDVTVGTDVDRLVQEAVKVGGRLDVWVTSLLVPRLKVSEDRIVNNAGIGGTEHHGMVHEMSEDEWGSPQDVARVAVFLASEDAAYVTGVPLPVDGGYCAQ